MKGEEIYNGYPGNGIKLIARQHGLSAFLNEDLPGGKWKEKLYTRVLNTSVPDNMSGRLDHWIAISDFVGAIKLANGDNSGETKEIADQYKSTLVLNNNSDDGSVKKSLAVLIGKKGDTNSDYLKKMRFHQGWWRTCVLGVNQGAHPKIKNEIICSSIENGKENELNFLDTYAIQAVKDTIQERENQNGNGGGSKGMFDQNRLFNNLLSSQPLCFNFFGKLKYDLKLATKLLSKFYPNIKVVTGIYFEFVPNASTNGDNSAHDIAIEFTDENDKNGLIGIECKYTEPFSPKIYNKAEYKRIYNASNAFSVDYDKFMNPMYNQLFRNQLIAESALTNGGYEHVYTGLFYSQNDANSEKIGCEFQNMIKNGTNRFKLITYKSFIEELQKINVDWNTREWTMLLWARYMGTKLSCRINS